SLILLLTTPSPPYTYPLSLHDALPICRESVDVSARAHSQPRSWFHLSEFQFDRRPHVVRERGTAADLPRFELERKKETCDRRARARRHGPSRQAPAQPALRRSAATRCC